MKLYAANHTSNSEIPPCREGEADGILVIDTEQTIVFANDRANTLLGATDSLLGSRIVDVIPELGFQGDDLASKACFLEMNTHQLRSLHAVYRPFEAGKGALVILRDQQQKVAQQRTLRSQQLELVRRLVLRLNHELKNPLTSVLAGLQTLLIETDAKYESWLRLILTEARSIQAILNKLANDTSNEFGAFHVVNVTAVIQQALSNMDTQLKKKRVEIKIVPSSENVYVRGYELSLVRAVTNLVANSIEACASGGCIVLGIRPVTADEQKLHFPDRTEEFLAIYCQDSGTGLPEDVSISSIFRPFVTTKKRSLGIGLPVAQQIIEHHRGKIMLNCDTMGTCFEILLPSVTA